MASTSKSTLFDDSDEEIDITTNSDYAKKYDTWRQKEVLQTLKARYGDDVPEDSSSSEEEDETARELTQELEKDFFKTLSYLKKKDPCIYDKDVKFFKSSEPVENIQNPKQKKGDKPLFLRDYERKIIVERDGKLSDDDSDSSPNVKNPTSMSVVEEEKAIKDSFKAVLHDSDDEGNAWGGLFEARKKTSDELKKEKADYRDWLMGQENELTDKNVESQLKPLHDFWNDPNLDSGERFLKDYILNKKFLDPDDADHVPSYDEIVHDSDEGLSEDEATFAKQEEFETKYNFRFEEPDQEFIKRYPRTMENSLRRKDTRRKEKRDDVKQRKVAQKERMKEDLKQLKSLKRKEIIEKIEKLKEITGNAHVGFEDNDLEGDFDPEAHDKRMSELFSQDYYVDGEEEKPELPDLDAELELENWDEWGGDGGENASHCEDPNFNMDCDYNPTAKFQAELINATTKKKRGRKSKLAQALARKKPVFDPKDRTFEQYVDEYYGMDFEDVIGDLPVRFKYRSVMPNSYGLTIDEILKADDKELNQWVSVKKAVKYLPENVEKQEFDRYQRKARNVDYKKKILKSLYIEEEDQLVVERKPKKKKLKKLKGSEMSAAAVPEVNDAKNMKSNGIKIKVEEGEHSEELSVDEQKHKKKLEKLKGNELKVAEITKEIDEKKKKSQKIKFEEGEHSVDEQKHTKKKLKKNEMKMIALSEENDNNDLESVDNKQGVEAIVDHSSRKKSKQHRIKTESMDSNASDTHTIIPDIKVSKKRKLEQQGKIITNNGQTISDQAMKKRKVEQSPTITNTLTNLKKKTKKKNKSIGSIKTVNQDKGVITVSRRMKKNKKQAMKKKEIVTSSEKSPHQVAVNVISTKQKVRKESNGKKDDKTVDFSDARLQAYGLHPKKFKNYIKYGKK